MTRKPSTIPCSPRGWWYNRDREADCWTGPFDTPEEAEKVARMLMPGKQKSLVLINLQLWEQREILIEKCPYCKNGFIHPRYEASSRCCTACEGTGRVPA